MVSYDVNVLNGSEKKVRFIIISLATFILIFREYLSKLPIAEKLLLIIVQKEFCLKIATKIKNYWYPISGFKKSFQL